MKEPLSAFDEVRFEDMADQVSRAESKALVGEVIDWQSENYYQAKAQRYRPWPVDPVFRVTLDGQVNKNLPLRPAFSRTAPPNLRIVKSPMRRFGMEGPDGRWGPAYAPLTSPALKRALLKWRGPWKTRR